MSDGPSRNADTGSRYDREPQPGDGPDYHADHKAWERREASRNADYGGHPIDPDWMAVGPDNALAPRPKSSLTADSVGRYDKEVDSWLKWLEHISTCDAAHCRNANGLLRALLSVGVDPAAIAITSATDGTHVVDPRGIS